MADSDGIDSIEALRALLLSHAEKGKPVGTVELTELTSVISLSPEDMTVKVEAGMRLDELQARLREVGQLLPIDPWDDSVRIKHLLDENIFGPRRYGFGTIREHLIGMEMMLPDGRLVESGGNVVKNVAGYDLQKVFIGARQSLGIIVSATFKLLPIPAHEAWLASGFVSATDARILTDEILESPVVPIVLDWTGNSEGVQVLVGFSGSKQQVEWQLDQLSGGAWKQADAPSYDAAYFGGAGDWRSRRSVLPSRLSEIVDGLAGQEFIVRAGNGLLWSPTFGGPVQREESIELGNRLKQTFDPLGLLPDIDR